MFFLDYLVLIAYNYKKAPKAPEFLLALCERADSEKMLGGPLSSWKILFSA